MLIVGGMYLLSPRRPTDPKPVQVAQAEVCDISDSVTIHGQVSELKRIESFAHGLSVVEQIYVKKGQAVSKGERLMRLRLCDDQQARSEARYSDFEAFAQSMLTAEPEQWEAMAQAIIQNETQETHGDGTQVYYLYSGIAGTVMDVTVQTGDSVSAIFPCVSISDLSKLCIRAEADETSVKKLKTGQSCTISIPALTEEQSAGTITEISPYAATSLSLLGDSGAQTEVIVSIEGNPALKPGYTASVRVITDICHDAVLVPFEAIAQDENNVEYVMVYRQGRAVRQNITTRYELENQAEVTSGVAGGDLLILSPDGIKEGEKVTANALS